MQRLFSWIKQLFMKRGSKTIDSFIKADMEEMGINAMSIPDVVEDTIAPPIPPTDAQIRAQLKRERKAKIRLSHTSHRANDDRKVKGAFGG